MWRCTEWQNALTSSAVETWKFRYHNAMSFKNNHPLLLAFVQLCLLRQGPQVLPASGFLLGVLMALNLAIASLAWVNEYGLLHAFLRAIVDLAAGLALVYMILLIAMKSTRTLQTMIALTGTGIAMGILSLPLIWLIPEEPQDDMFLLILRLVFIWNILIIGNIFRHALSINLALGVLTSIGYILMLLVMFYSVFPGT